MFGNTERRYRIGGSRMEGRNGSADRENPSGWTRFGQQFREETRRKKEEMFYVSHNIHQDLFPSSFSFLRLVYIYRRNVASPFFRGAKAN